MAVKTVNAGISDVLNAAVEAVASSAKTGKTATNRDDRDAASSFGDVLNSKMPDKASSKTDASAGTVHESVKSDKTQKPDDTDSGMTDAKQTQADQSAVEEKPVENEAPAEEPVAEEKPVAEETPADDAADVPDAAQLKSMEPEPAEPVDEATAEQIAEALSQIIEQVKQELDVSDEEILAGLEELGLHPTDLLNTDSMALLVTELAGDGEMMSLVTNEELYTALQDLTETVETLSAELLENTGLTVEELDIVLEQLSVPQEEPKAEVMEAEELPVIENDGEAMTEENAPVILVSDSTKPVEAKETQAHQAQDDMVDNLADNVSENTAETGVQRQKPDNGAQEHESGAKNFDGQQGMAQNMNENVNETTQTFAETATTSYTSETTESILNQLADVVKILKNEDITEMEMQLHPASLGTVNVSLATKGGTVTAEFTTQNEAVKAAIESQVSQLIANLEEQGVKVEAVEVSVASHGMEKNLDESNQDGQNRQEQEEQQRIQGLHRSSINLNSLADGEELIEEMQSADDATRIAMEMMAANGNSMDLLA
ncbi:MAG: flagellar hook-length control protein FliK [Lachnospiraceae bacterium]|nr:flagellar hook-length control protein FliK [Lachnospiraceae bacterium]